MEKNKVLQNPEDGLYELAGFDNSLSGMQDQQSVALSMI